MRLTTAGLGAPPRRPIQQHNQEETEAAAEAEQCHQVSTVAKKEKDEVVEVGRLVVYGHGTGLLTIHRPPSSALPITVEENCCPQLFLVHRPNMQSPRSVCSVSVPDHPYSTTPSVLRPYSVRPSVDFKLLHVSRSWPARRRLKVKIRGH